MNTIDREELRRELERDGELRLVMTLSSFSYGIKHIPGSLHFETVEDALAALDPDEEIVVYCADVFCAASIYAYHLLERAGYKHVRRYGGGIADWEEAGYPLEHGSREPSAGGSTIEPARLRAWTNPRRPWLVCA